MEAHGGSIERELELFHAALEREPADREPFVRTTAGDPGLAGRVLRLLDAHRELEETPAGARFETPPLGPPPEQPPFEGVPGYRVVRLLGAGGMAEVYAAEQEQPRRDVALKILRPGLASPALLARFEHEAEILGRLHHPGIAQVYEAGIAATDRGERPWFAMELVEGSTLTRYAGEAGLGADERLALLAEVCDAIHHAHQQGVVHRDLKPANILVDRSGRPRVLDFGVARVTGTGVHLTTVQTAAGTLIGTVPYMSPEQVAGDGRPVDTRSDVYALGVVGYELLTGELPHDVRELAIPAAARRIGTEDARPLAAVDPAFRGDVDTIFGKALERDRERRYGSAAELGADLRRYLRHEPIAARPASLGYQLRKFARRNRGLVTGAALALAALVLGLAAAVANALEARSALADFDLVALVVRLREAREAEEELYPAWPERAGALRAWLEEHAAPLLAARADVGRALAKLRGRGAPDPVEPGRLVFDDRRDQFLWDTLDALRADLAEFADGERGLCAAVRERLAWATSVRAASIEDRSGEWERAIAAIAASDGVAASELYRGLQIAPQTGLVPLGMDPASGLWEFAQLRSGRGAGAVPRRGPEDGELAYDGREAGLVFVLLPGGTFTMGCQSEDPLGPRYDPRAEPHESPPHPVTLAPFFLSKYELTQAQWERLSGGETPSYYRAGSHSHGVPTVTGDHPVEQVSWRMAVDLLERHGLVLPTEAQWEYSCRAGTETVWSPGDEVPSLRGYVNVADAAAARAAPWKAESAIDDGHVIHAPVGSFQPNAFGLLDMHGNVFEWCLDTFAFYERPARGGDGLRMGPEGNDRVSRGGCFRSTAVRARSGNRNMTGPDIRSVNLGLRPARPLL